MTIEDLRLVTHPVAIDDDPDNFAAAAFERAATALPDDVSGDSLAAFRQFLTDEAKEMLRQANYYAAMSPRYYHENVPASRHVEALAFEAMLLTFDQLTA